MVCIFDLFTRFTLNSTENFPAPKPQNGNNVRLIVSMFLLQTLGSPRPMVKSVFIIRKLFSFLLFFIQYHENLYRSPELTPTHESSFDSNLTTFAETLSQLPKALTAYKVCKHGECLITRSF